MMDHHDGSGSSPSKEKGGSRVRLNVHHTVLILDDNIFVPDNCTPGVLHDDRAKTKNVLQKECGKSFARRQGKHFCLPLVCQRG